MIGHEARAVPVIATMTLLSQLKEELQAAVYAYVARSDADDRVVDVADVDAHAKELPGRRGTVEGQRSEAVATEQMRRALWWWMLWMDGRQRRRMSSQREHQTRREEKTCSVARAA